MVAKIKQATGNVTKKVKKHWLKGMWSVISGFLLICLGQATDIIDILQETGMIQTEASEKPNGQTIKLMEVERLIKREFKEMDSYLDILDDELLDSGVTKDSLFMMQQMMPLEIELNMKQIPTEPPDSIKRQLKLRPPKPTKLRMKLK
jgi:hypothetical protein